MARIGTKILTFFLAFAVIGAASLCACAMHAQQIREHASKEHACCDESPEPDPTQDCGSCSRVQSVDHTTQVSSIAPAVFFITSPLFDLPLPQTSPAKIFVEHPAAPPPILLDLVHTSCQLTV